MKWFSLYAGTFVLAWILSLILTRVFMAVAETTGFLDMPKGEQHKQHKKATPLLGGAAMLLTFLLTVGAGGILILPYLQFPEVAGGMELIFREGAVMTLCAAAITLLGTWDDKHAMKAGPKFIGQLVIVLCAVLWGGGRISVFVQSPLFSVVITVFWFLLICNAINFFDNMDGLAAGTASLAFLFFTIAASVNQQYLVAILGAVSTGCAAGFWFWNRNPARIFMGDGGSLFLGFMLAWISTRVTYFNPMVSTTRFPVLIPLFVLAIPLLDTLTVVIIRLKNHKPFYIGDHNHISHRFWHMGLTRAQAVFMVHTLVLISGLGALPLLWGDERTSGLLIVQGVVIYLFVLFLQLSLKGEDRQ